MKKGEASKAKIVEAAGELFWKQGYAATGIRDILDATGLPKGSFYFYFKSKSDVAREVIGYYSRVIIDVLKDTEESADSWEAFCDVFLCAFEEKLKDKQYYGCPLAVLGMEPSRRSWQNLIGKLWIRSEQYFSRCCKKVECPAKNWKRRLILL